MWTSEQGLSFTLAVLYGSICVASGVQSARILLNRHSITSFQFAFHILCFLWTSLRTTFFASTAPLPRTLTLLIYWFPIDIQFATFSLMVVFYAYVIYKREWESKRALLLTVYIIANVTMFSLTTAYILFSCKHACLPTDELELAHHIYMSIQFLILMITYAYYSKRLIKLAGSKKLAIMQSQSISLHKIYYITLTTFLIFSTRFCYNVGNAIGFWEIEIGGDEGGEKSVNPVAFSLFLLWEITPTLMLLIYFRHIPRTNFSFRESLWMLLWSCWIREQDYLDCPIDSGSESLDLIQSENAYENEDMGHVGNFSVSPHQNNWNHSTDTQPLLDQVENEKINSSFAIGDPSKQSLENLSFNRENNSSSNFLQSKTLMDHNNKSPALVNKKSQGIKNLFQIASNPYRSDTQPTLRVTIPQDLSSLSNRALLANNSSHKNVFLDSKRYDTEDESPSSEKIQLSQPSM